MRSALTRTSNGRPTALAVTSIVVVEAHQIGLRDGRRHHMEAIEPAGLGNELGLFGFEHLPDRHGTSSRGYANAFSSVAKITASDLS